MLPAACLRARGRVLVFAEGNSPNHALEMYLHVIDPTRDVVLMNKVRNVAIHDSIVGRD